MNNFKLTIGIEIHAQLNTRSKMFSSSISSANDEPNTNINEIDLGLPGALPSPNKQAVIKAIWLATALNMKINNMLSFDRKNYYYQDLPKGFQITQMYQPIGKDGSIKINDRIVNIERIHLEEDTAKQLNINDTLCLDYNRSGIALVEIVSRPDIESSSEAVEYLKQIKRILIFLNISDGKMEDGSLRADVNVSVAPVGSNKHGTRVEIKNLNSFVNVARAIDYEYHRQIRQLLGGGLIFQETRRWDDVKNQTVVMRLKEDAVDYHYMREPNIIEINIDKLIIEAKNQMNRLPILIEQFLKKLHVPNNFIEQLLDNYDAYKVFEYINAKCNEPQIVVTWVIGELAALVKANNHTFIDLSTALLDKVIEMLNLLIQQDINNKQAKIILEIIYSNPSKSVTDLIKKLNFNQIKDVKIITNYLNEYISLNCEIAKQYNKRPERVEKFFIGLLMKDTKGQANPVISVNILRDLLKKIIQ